MAWSPDPKRARKLHYRAVLGWLAAIWGLRTVIPPSLRQSVLTELHKGPSWNCTYEINSPQSCLVAENRSGDYPWMSTVQQNTQGSSGLTASSMVLADSSTATCSCRFCHQSGKKLPHHGWGLIYKWPEVIVPMKTTTANSTINAMRNIFARYGLPTQVVSDNSPPLQSAEYEVL